MMKSASVRFLEIPYKGTQAQYTDLLAGRIDLMFSSESAALPHIATGKIKGIAIAGPRRSSRAPDLPTMAESGMPGLEDGGMAWAVRAGRDPAGNLGKAPRRASRVHSRAQGAFCSERRRDNAAHSRRD